MFIEIEKLEYPVEFIFQSDKYIITHYGSSCGEKAFLANVNGKRNEHLFLRELHPFISNEINKIYAELLL